jgi:hypothetical protein
MARTIVRSLYTVVLIFAFSAGFLAAETTGGQTYQIMDGVRRAAAANLTGATTIQAEILDANMVRSMGLTTLPTLWTRCKAAV